MLAALLLGARPAPPLVDVEKTVPGLLVELKYATEDNFLKKAVYPKSARCLLVPEAAEKLKAAAEALAPLGFRLKVWDCYRPLEVQRQMWALVPKRGYVADPNNGGSHHNRGAAVDLTLVTRDGSPVEMPSAFDHFGKEAHHWYQGGSDASKKHRTLLRKVMEEAGFTRNPMEWWHWELPNAIDYALREDAFAEGAP